MSSSIHYKFRTTNVSKTLAFDGQSIKVPELKKAICAAENIKAELFDLIFFNSFNKQPYSGDDEIPRNSSVTVQRVPIENGAKIPKISNPEISATTKAIPDVPDSAAHIKQEDFSKMTEEERIKHIRVQSTFKYTTNNYNRKPMANNMQQAPPDYLCNRCNQLGHFPKACPLLNIRKTTGIPNEELMETTADDPQAMLHPSGKFMIPIMHYKAREQRKLMEEQKKKGLTSSQEQKNKAVKKELPSELKCPLCNDIFKEALVTGCCGESFCADCIQQTMSDAIAADLNSQCPNCKAPIGASALFPNNSLRES
uniref:Uncharacterized protein n=1 Tax=Panagrolaimus davidi TaxID=227884 RepID=A0A914QCY2_9BILA